MVRFNPTSWIKQKPDLPVDSAEAGGVVKDEAKAPLLHRLGLVASDPKRRPSHGGPSNTVIPGPGQFNVTPGDKLKAIPWIAQEISRTQSGGAVSYEHGTLQVSQGKKVTLAEVLDLPDGVDAVVVDGGHLVVSGPLVRRSIFSEPMKATHVIFTPVETQDGSLRLDYCVGRQDGERSFTEGSSTATAQELLTQMLPPPESLSFPPRVLARVQVAFPDENPAEVLDAALTELKQWGEPEANYRDEDGQIAAWTKDVVRAALGLEGSQWADLKLAPGSGQDGYSAISYDGCIKLQNGEGEVTQASLRDGMLLPS